MNLNIESNYRIVSSVQEIGQDLSGKAPKGNRRARRANARMTVNQMKAAREARLRDMKKEAEKMRRAGRARLTEIIGSEEAKEFAELLDSGASPETVLGESEAA